MSRLSSWTRARSAACRILLPVGLFLLMAPLGACHGGEGTLSYSELKHRIEAGEVASVRVSSQAIEAVPTDEARRAGAPERWRAVPLRDDPTLVALLDARGVDYGGIPEGRPKPLAVAAVIVGGLTLLGFIFYLQRRSGPTGALGGVARLRLRDASGDAPRARFDDVAGVDEVKEELQELVAFLESPDRFQRLGVKVPKGVLLVGAPGTGKTLLAQAVAGEAGVPFFSMSGSDFVEVYVGVGAARVRKLFNAARSKAPCIVFIDELDAIGKSRAGGPAANDEREQALNQLLVSMDGFESSQGVIVMGATNRPEILDPALLRPGRFDRQVALGRPDVAGREAILRVHGRKVRIASDVDLGELARRTPGFTGADLANVLNEAGLIAARRDATEIGEPDIDAAVDRVIAGLEKKGPVTNAKERRIIAFHEAGHAIVAASSEHADPVKKISIVPRGIAALGYTQQLPEDRNILQRDELLDRLAVLLGGRAAEHLTFEQVSTGASNDLERASAMARRMVAEFGMSDSIGPVAYARAEGRYLDDDAKRSCSEDTSRRIDGEVQTLLSNAFERACRLLTERRTALQRVSERLLEAETMSGDELLAVLAEESALSRIAAEA